MTLPPASHESTQLTVGANGELFLGGVQVGWDELYVLPEDQLEIAHKLASSGDERDMLLAIRIAQGLKE